MNLLYPKITAAHLRRILKHAALGALAGGLYGVMHDEITYHISPEYFTRLKFAQFSWMNFGLPERLQVAEIGFLAGGSAVFIAVWFLARLALARFPDHQAGRMVMRGAVICLTGALLGAVCGDAVGWYHDGDYSRWGPLLMQHQPVLDVRHFVEVACIHNGSYAGAFLGLIAALFGLRKTGQRDAAFPAT